MKKLNLLYAAAISLAFASCSDEMQMLQGSDGNTIITADLDTSQSETRSAINSGKYADGNVGIYWTPDDSIGVYSASDRNVPFVNMSSYNTGRSKFSGTLSGNPLYAYYPYNASNDGREATSLHGNLPLNQEYNSNTKVIEGDYKYGIAREGVANEFSFIHLFSLIHFSINATGTQLENQKLRKISVAFPNGKYAGGDFIFNAINGEYSFTGNASDINVLSLRFPLEPIVSNGNTVEGYASCAPVIKANDKLEIKVFSDQYVATFNATVVYDFEPNHVYNFNLNLSEFELTIADAPADPIFNYFKFTVDDNAGKILDKKVVSMDYGKSVSEIDVKEEQLSIDGNKISGMIPYLYDFNLVPTFDVPKGIKVLVNGEEQISGQSVQDFSKPVTYTLHSEMEDVEYTVNVSNTGLPVVVIKQSSGMNSKWFGNLSLRSKDSDWVKDDEITVYDVNGKYTMSTQKGGVRLRGNSTQGFPKKPLAIKLNEKQQIGDMLTHKRWVLLANWLDNSMIRNNTAFAIAHATEEAWGSGNIEQGIPWNPHGVNVELVIDGRHVGNYFLGEQIKIGGKRLNIHDCYEDVLADHNEKGKVEPTFENCGYLIECDDNYDETYKFITSKRGIPFQFKDDILPNEYVTNIQTKVNNIEQYLINGKYSAAYELLDINSVIDQWIIYELTMNDEYKHPKSVYMYMDGGADKLHAGPVWDFDYQTFPNNSNITSLNNTYGGESAPSANAWMCAGSSPVNKVGNTPSTNDKPYMWYPLLFKDESFRTAVKTRWNVIYPYLLGVTAKIYEQGKINESSWYVNHAMWPLAFNRSSIVGWAPAFSGDENLSDYNAVVANLANMYQNRLDWMNSAIQSGNFPTTAK